MFFGFLPSLLATLRIAARSASSGTPVKSCSTTRATTKGISSVRSAVAPQLATCFTCSSVTFLPSQLRSTDSSTTRIDTGRREILAPRACSSAGSEYSLPFVLPEIGKSLSVLNVLWGITSPSGGYLRHARTVAAGVLNICGRLQKRRSRLRRRGSGGGLRIAGRCHLRLRRGFGLRGRHDGRFQLLVVAAFVGQLAVQLRIEQHALGGNADPDQAVGLVLEALCARRRGHARQAVQALLPAQRDMAFVLGVLVQGDLVAQLAIEVRHVRAQYVGFVRFRIGFLRRWRGLGGLALAGLGLRLGGGFLAFRLLDGVGRERGRGGARQAQGQGGGNQSGDGHYLVSVAVGFGSSSAAADSGSGRPASRARCNTVQ